MLQVKDEDDDINFKINKGKFKNCSTCSRETPKHYLNIKVIPNLNAKLNDDSKFLKENLFSEDKLWLREANFPFLNEFVYLNSTAKQPINARLKLKTKEEMGLDKEQFDAINLALSNKLTLIHGPPGTGKTFIGVKYVQLFLEKKIIVEEKNRKSFKMSNSHDLPHESRLGPVFGKLHTRMRRVGVVDWTVASWKSV